MQVRENVGTEEAGRGLTAAQVVTLKRLAKAKHGELTAAELARKETAVRFSGEDEARPNSLVGRGLITVSVTKGGKATYAITRLGRKVLNTL